MGHEDFLASGWYGVAEGEDDSLHSGSQSQGTDLLLICCWQPDALGVASAAPCRGSPVHITKEVTLLKDMKAVIFFLFFFFQT